jgi:hypothetical protein
MGHHIFVILSLLTFYYYNNLYLLEQKTLVSIKIVI